MGSEMCIRDRVYINNNQITSSCFDIFVSKSRSLSAGFLSVFARNTYTLNIRYASYHMTRVIAEQQTDNRRHKSAHRRILQGRNHVSNNRGGCHLTPFHYILPSSPSFLSSFLSPFYPSSPFSLPPHSEITPLNPARIAKGPCILNVTRTRPVNSNTGSLLSDSKLLLNVR